VPFQWPSPINEGPNSGIVKSIFCIFTIRSEPSPRGTAMIFDRFTNSRWPPHDYRQAMTVML
jgi:hypothetical protein